MEKFLGWVIPLEKQLLEACKHGKVDEVKKLLLNENINVNAKDENYDGYTPLIRACIFGHADIVELLLKDSRVNINEGDKYERTAFSYACESGQVDIVKLMLADDKIDVNKANNRGWTPLMKACGNGNIEIVQYILASGKEVNINAKNMVGKTAANLAKKANKSSIGKLLETYEKHPSETRDRLRKQLGVENFPTVEELEEKSMLRLREEEAIIEKKHLESIPQEYQEIVAIIFEWSGRSLTLTNSPLNKMHTSSQELNYFISEIRLKKQFVSQEDSDKRMQLIKEFLDRCKETLKYINQVYSQNYPQTVENLKSKISSFIQRSNFLPDQGYIFPSNFNSDYKGMLARIESWITEKQTQQLRSRIEFNDLKNAFAMSLKDMSILIEKKTDKLFIDKLIQHNELASQLAKKLTEPPKLQSTFPTQDLLRFCTTFQSYLEKEKIGLDLLDHIKENATQTIVELELIIQNPPNPTRLNQIKEEIEDLEIQIISIDRKSNLPRNKNNQKLKTEFSTLQKKLWDSMGEYRKELFRLGEFSKKYFPDVVTLSPEIQDYFDGDGIITEHYVQGMFDSMEIIKKGIHNVYKVEHEGEIFAVKEFFYEDAIVLKRFEEQRKMMKRLGSHPNVIPLLGVYHDSHSKKVYVKVPFYSTPLEQRVNEAELTEEEFQFIFQQILFGLHQIHDKKLISGSVKPSSIMMKEKNVPVITDFNVNKDRAIISSMITPNGFAPQFVAPEILINKEPTHLSDMYSLGMTMIACKYPDIIEKPRVNFLDFMNSLPANCNPYFKDLLIKLLDPIPEKRLSTKETLEHPYFSKSNHQDLFIMIPYYWKFPYYIHDVTIHMKDQIEELMNNSSINNQKFRVVKIERIENEELWNNYCNFKNQMIKSRKKYTKIDPEIEIKKKWMRKDFKLNWKLNEYHLFFGTNAIYVESVKTKGLDERIGGRDGFFGQGIYQAEKSSFADSFTEPDSRNECFIFLNRVLLGETVIVDQSSRGLGSPPINPYSETGDHYDSVIGHVNRVINRTTLRPREFIVYNRNQVYPEFLITYNRLPQESQ